MTDRRRASGLPCSHRELSARTKIAARYRLHTQSILPFVPAAFQIRGTSKALAATRPFLKHPREDTMMTSLGVADHIGSRQAADRFAAHKAQTSRNGARDRQLPALMRCAQAGDSVAYV